MLLQSTLFTSSEEERHPLLFEVVPPEKGKVKERLKQHRAYLEKLFNEVDVSAINLPEIQDESKKGENGERKSPFKERVSPRDYARTLSEYFDTEFVINRVSVKIPPQEQEKWVLETWRDYQIRNIIFVGGESSSVEYRGPSVPEGNEMVKEYLDEGEFKYNDGTVKPTNFSVGNIAIPTRRKEDFDEPERMLKKVRSGAEFFTTQIITEADTPISLMRDLHDLMERKGEIEDGGLPALIWSFSPISSEKDVNFLRWLGVYIPEELEQRILQSDNPAEKSIQLAQEVWEKMIDFNRQLPVSFPMGINISVMGLRNFDNGIALAKELTMVGVTD